MRDLRVLALLAMLFGCGQLHEVSGHETLDGPQSFSREGSECGVLSAPTQVYKGRALGLSLLDAEGESILSDSPLDCSKDTIVFLHGWSPSGEPTPFSSVNDWQEKGFNTLVFRWHDLSEDLSLFAIFEKSSRIAAERFAVALQDLYAQLGGQDYKGELRVAGHSFGAKVAIDAIARVGMLPGTGLEPVAGRFVRVDRLALLDPAILTNLSGPELRICQRIRLSLDVGSARDSDYSTELAQEASRTRALLSFVAESTRVEIYAANVASAFSLELSKSFHLQSLTRSEVLSCFIGIEGLNPTQVHGSVVTGYLGSIAQNAPADPNAWSAATPTRDLGGSKGWYILDSGHVTGDWAEHTYRKVELPNQYISVDLDGHCMNENTPSSSCGVELNYVIEF